MGVLLPEKRLVGLGPDTAAGHSGLGAGGWPGFLSRGRWPPSVTGRRLRQAARAGGRDSHTAVSDSDARLGHTVTARGVITCT